MTGAGLPHFVPGPDGFDRAVFKKEAHRDLTPAAAAMTQLDATGLLSPADYVPCEASTFCRDSHAGHLPPAPKHGRKRPPPHLDLQGPNRIRTEERRGGKEGVSTCR